MKKIQTKISLDFFKSKRMRYGGYAALVTLAAAVIVVVVNLIVQQIPGEIDMTENRLFTLSEQTLGLIDRLDAKGDPVTIYGLYQPNNENPNVVDVIRKYERASDVIRYERVDPDKDPGFLRKYESEDSGLTNGTLIVDSGDIFKVIPGIDMYDVSYSQQGEPRVMGFKAEQKITNALLYVTSGYTPTIYQLTGHGEYTLIQLGLYTTIEKENFTIEDLNLLTTDSVPEDADIVICIGPETDLTEKEADDLRTYLEDENGSALFLFDFTGEDFPLFNSLLASFGVEAQNAIVMEGDADRLFDPEIPFFLAPEILSHDITDPLRADDMTILMPNVIPINTLEVKKRNTEIEPLLQTSRQSWIRENPDEIRSMLKQPSDTAGPVTPAVAIYKRKMEMDEPEGYRLVVAGNAKFVGYIPPFGTLKPNIDFLMNSLSWLNKRTESISVRSRSLFEFPLRISGTLQLVYAGIFVILIPVGILAAGLIVWLRRRHL